MRSRPPALAIALIIGFHWLLNKKNVLSFYGEIFVIYEMGDIIFLANSDLKSLQLVLNVYI